MKFVVDNLDGSCDDGDEVDEDETAVAHLLDERDADGSFVPEVDEHDLVVDSEEWSVHGIRDDTDIDTAAVYAQSTYGATGDPGANRPSTASTVRSASPTDAHYGQPPTLSPADASRSVAFHDEGTFAYGQRCENVHNYEEMEESESLWHEDVVEDGNDGCDDDIESRINEEYAKFQQEKEARSLSRPGTASRASSPTRQRSAERAASASKLLALRNKAGGGDHDEEDVPRQTYVPRDRPSSAGRLMDKQYYHNVSLSHHYHGAGSSHTDTLVGQQQFLETLEEKNSFGSLRYSNCQAIAGSDTIADAASAGGSANIGNDDDASADNEDRRAMPSLDVEQDAGTVDVNVTVSHSTGTVIGGDDDDEEEEERVAAMRMAHEMEEDEEEDEYVQDDDVSGHQCVTPGGVEASESVRSDYSTGAPGDQNVHVSTAEQGGETAETASAAALRACPGGDASDIGASRRTSTSSAAGHSRHRQRPSSAYPVLENVANYYHSPRTSINSYYFPQQQNNAFTSIKGTGRRGKKGGRARPSTAMTPLRGRGGHYHQSPFHLNCSNAVLSQRNYHSSAFIAPSRIGWGEVMNGDVLGKINEANAISRMLHLRRRYRLVLNSPTTASVAVYDAQQDVPEVSNTASSAPLSSETPTTKPGSGEPRGTSASSSSSSKPRSRDEYRGEVLMIETFVQAYTRLKQRLLLQYNRDRRLR